MFLWQHRCSFENTGVPLIVDYRKNSERLPEMRAFFNSSFLAKLYWPSEKRKRFHGRM